MVNYYVHNEVEWTQQLRVSSSGAVPSRCGSFTDTLPPKNIETQNYDTLVHKMPSFVCFARNCGLTASAPTEAELMTKSAAHAKSAYDMDPLPPDVMVKVKAATKK